MNSEVTTNSQSSTTEPKKTNLADNQNRHRIHRTRDHMEGYQWGGGRMGGMVQGIGSINSRHEIDRGAQNSMGNGEAKELICMTHEHELKWRNAVGGWVQGRGE